jgi:hypothetical protein
MKLLWNHLKPCIKSILLPCKFVLYLLLTRLVIRVLFLTHNRQIAVTLNTSKLNDGSGAQIQRLLSTFLIASVFKIGYLHSNIVSIQIHPLDSFQDSDSLQKYLVRINEKFLLPSSHYNFDAFEVLERDSLKLFDLAHLRLMSILTGRRFLIRIVDPYPVSEYLVSQFALVKSALPNQVQATSNQLAEGIKTVVIHHRQGVGGQVIYPGQLISRELSIDYFLKVLGEITRTIDQTSLRIVVHTDAPLTDSFYIPTSEQTELWEGTPRFENGKLELRASEIEGTLTRAGYAVSIKHGGDPLVAIEDMVVADFLIMGRSSLSYVGGILNKSGKVFAAPNFWHKSMPHWINI